MWFDLWSLISPICEVYLFVSLSPLFPTSLLLFAIFFSSFGPMLLIALWLNKQFAWFRSFCHIYKTFVKLVYKHLHRTSPKVTKIRQQCISKYVRVMQHNYNYRMIHLHCIYIRFIKPITWLCCASTLYVCSNKAYSEKNLFSGSVLQLVFSNKNIFIDHLLFHLLK